MKRFRTYSQEKNAGTLPVPGNVPAFFSAAKVSANYLTLKTYLNKSLEIYPNTQRVNAIEDARLTVGVVEAKA